MCQDLGRGLKLGCFLIFKKKKKKKKEWGKIIEGFDRMVLPGGIIEWCWCSRQSFRRSCKIPPTSYQYVLSNVKQILYTTVYITCLTLLRSEWTKLHRVLAILSAIGLKRILVIVCVPSHYLI